MQSLDCKLKGWNLFRGYNDVPISIGDQLRMDEGKLIGDLARDLYPLGHLISEYGEDALQITSEYINRQDSTILFEAAFKSQQFITRADILIPTNDSWHLIEVKSSTNFLLKSKSEQQKYIDDMAYTLMVIGNAIPIDRISIMTISKDYRLGMDLNRLFVTSEVTERVVSRMFEFDKFKNIVAQEVTLENSPKPRWIYGCKSCEFFHSICLGKGIRHPIFNLPRITEKKCDELFRINTYEINFIPENIILTNGQMTIRNATIKNEPYFTENLKEDLEKIEWPIYYLDFETFKTALPIYTDVAPHEQIVTQYSLHCRHHVNSDLEHMDYLANPKLDCRRELVEHLLQDIGDRGSIIVYSNFEKTMLKALQKKFSFLENKIEDTISRLIDLKIIIENNYYHPDFYGSYSIKNVLPILIPEMSYADLSIKNGDEAIAVFSKMVKNDLTIDQVKNLRKQLLDYCYQDTLAMVKIHKKLLSVVGIIKQ